MILITGKIVVDATTAPVLDPGRGRTKKGRRLGDRASAGRMSIVGKDGSFHTEPVRRTGFAFADASN